MESILLAAGRLRGPEDAMREALELWESRERAKATLLVQIDQAEASLTAGKGRVITEQSMQDLANDVYERGRARRTGVNRRRRESSTFRHSAGGPPCAQSARARAARP